MFATRLFRRAAFAALGVAAIACGDSLPTASNGEAAAPFSALTGEDVAGLASVDLGGRDLAVRLGARPTEIAVSVGGEITRYDALVIAKVEGASRHGSGIRRTLIAWAGGDRPVAVLNVTTLGDVGSFSSRSEPADHARARAEGNWYNLARDSRWRATTGTASITIEAVGEECKLAEPRTNRVRCSLADFGVSVDGLFRLNGASPRAGEPAVRIQTSATRVNGVLMN
jgi:hypothetical protein